MKRLSLEDDGVVAEHVDLIGVIVELHKNLHVVLTNAQSSLGASAEECGCGGSAHFLSGCDLLGGSGNGICRAGEEVGAVIQGACTAKVQFVLR